MTSSNHYIYEYGRHQRKKDARQAATSRAAIAPQHLSACGPAKPQPLWLASGSALVCKVSRLPQAFQRFLVPAEEGHVIRPINQSRFMLLGV